MVEIVTGNYRQLSDAASSFIERYSREGLANLGRKRWIATPTEGLKSMLEGGIFTQEVTEIIGENSMNNGELMVHLLVHQLFHERNSEAIIITSNGSQNEDAIYRITHRYIEGKQNRHKPQECINVDDVAFDIIRRVFIVQCVDLIELAMILDEISNNRYRKASGNTSSPQRVQPLSLGNGDNLVEILSMEDSGFQSKATPSDMDTDIELSTVIIHLMSSIVEDSDSRVSWHDLPTICSKLRSIAVKMNLAMIISNYHKETTKSSSSSTTTTIISQENDDLENKKGQNAQWLMSSTRWNSTVDKRLEVTWRKYDRSKAPMKFTLQLTKSKHCSVPRRCYLALSEKGISEETINSNV